MPFDGDSLQYNKTTRQNKLKKKINTNRSNLFNQTIDFKDFIDT